MKPNSAAALALASLVSQGCAKPPTLIPAPTSVEIQCVEQNPGFVCQPTQVKPCTIVRSGEQVEISGVIDVVTRYADITNAAYPVPILVPDDPICIGRTDRLYRTPIELSTNDPALARSFVRLVGERVKLVGRLSDEVIVTSSQGPTFPLMLFVLILR